MRREEMADLTAFLAVADERNFTRAAAKLGMTQSALSQIVRRLEERIGIRLLARTTRSVAPTEAGERLLQTLRPALSELDASLDTLSDLRGKPRGTIRITSVEHAAKTIVYPALKNLLPAYPDINVEIELNYGLVDIVASGFDAGIRLGESVDKDMIAVRIGPDIPMVVVGSSDYFKRHDAPGVPQELVRHRAINLRLPTSGGLYVWEFAKAGRRLRVRVESALVFNTIDLIREAALDGFGLAFIPADHVLTHITRGDLISVLDGWCPSLPGYHIYYPNRRLPSQAFALLIEAVRYKQ